MGSPSAPSCGCGQFELEHSLVLRYIDKQVKVPGKRSDEECRIFVLGAVFETFGGSLGIVLIELGKVTFVKLLFSKNTPANT